MKKATALLAAALSAAVMLTACTSSDNSGNTQEGNVDDLVPAADIFEGCEELQGKDFELFRLPDVIEKPEYDGLYRFPDRRGGAEVPEEKQKALELMKACFGERFDESAVREEKNWDKSVIYQLSLPDDAFAAVLHGFPMNITKSCTSGDITPDFTVLGRFLPSEPEKTVELQSGSCTVAELLDGMQKRLDAEILPFIGGFEIVPLRIDDLKSSKGVSYAVIEYGIKYKGIMLEEDSPMWISQQRSGYQVTTGYSLNTLTLTVTDKNDYLVFSSSFAEQYPLAEKISEAIPLSGAVEILKNDLAEYMRCNLTSVELKYCCKITAPVITGTDSLEDSRILADYGKIETAYFEPTWCFYYKVTDENGEHREAVKVNALTGEITIDTAR